MKKGEYKRLYERQAHHQRGYSLIEMAIALLVIGLLIAPIADVYSTYLKQQKREKTRNYVSEIMTAINTYRTAKGTFPCPAGLNLLRTNPLYGVPVDCTRTGPLAAAPAPGACDLAKGICIEATTRASLIATGTPYQQRVIVGAVPFRVLQIPEEKTYDGYGSRFVYVLTESMGDLQTMDTLNGGISIKDPTQTKSLTRPDDSAVYAIVSPGPDKVGGWGIEGANVFRSCTGAVGADVANCNPGFEGGTPTTNALLVDGYESTALGATHFDDYMMYFDSQPDPLWRYIPGTNNIQDLTTKSVGIGVVTPTAGVQLDIAAATPQAGIVLDDGTQVTDSLLVYGYDSANPGVGNNGKIEVDRICDATGANCFDPIHIGGSQVAGEGMNCVSATDSMAGIDVPGNAGTGGADCMPVTMACPTGKVLNGIVNGAANCVQIPKDCPSGTTVSACGVNFTTTSIIASGGVFPATPQTVDTAQFGCQTAQWTCQIDGTLLRTTNNGLNCTGTSTACDCSQQGSGYAPGACPGSLVICSGNSTDTRDYSACGCQADVVTHPNCPSPWTGGQEDVTTHYSMPGCTASTTTSMANCQCSRPDPQQTNVPCVGPYNNGNAAIQSCPLDLATCTYSSSCTIDQSACQCIVPSPNTRTITGVTCPAPFAGTGSQDQIFNPTSCQWEDTGTVYNCNCPADYQEQAACPSPALGQQIRQHTFGAAPTCTETITPVPPAWDQSGCYCPADYTETAACDPPYSPANNKTRQHTYAAAPTCTETINPSPPSWDISACVCPVDYDEILPCDPPYTGGTKKRHHTIGAMPTCTDTPDATWDISACQCSRPNPLLTDLGCGSGYNAGAKTLTQNLQADCTYDAGTISNTCTCNPPVPNTQTVPCGSCASPWSGTQVCDETFDATPGVCAWGSPGTPYGCTCDTTPTNYTQSHDCTQAPWDGYDCYDPDQPDHVTVANTFTPPNTCTAGTPVVTPDGTCKLKDFKWQSVRFSSCCVTNAEKSGYNHLTDSCSCADHRATLSNPVPGTGSDVCVSYTSTDHNLYECNCQ